MGMIIDLVLMTFGSLLWYGFHAAQGIYPGDAGDLVTAAVTHGVPHPPGYPLYTLAGWLIHVMPVGTPAWRMAWLSIVPHVITILCVYLLTYRLVKSRMAALFASLVLVGNYLFILYSITPEVFALLDMFVAVLLLFAVVLHTRFRFGVFVAACFVLGLSLAHHPLIIALVPSLVFLIRPGYVRARATWRHGLAAIAAAGAGLLPYLYVFGTTGGTSMIVWDRPTTLLRFIRLITRADYGSFMSGGVVGHTLYERLLNVKAYFTFLIVDYTWVGVALAVAGCIWLWRHHRPVFFAFLSAFILLGPGFSFYASFLIVNRFVLGTVERFALPSYVVVAPLIGIGMMTVSTGIAALMPFARSAREKQRQLAFLFAVVFFLFPLVNIGMNAWRFRGFSADRTTDRYIQDLFASAPKHAIILLFRDTPLFGAQYMRYAVGYRRDTIVLHAARMTVTDYHEVIHHVFPGVNMPSESVAPDAYIAAFIAANRTYRPIASNMVIPVGDDWVWVPHGLLYVLTPKKSAPSQTAIRAENDALWHAFSHPLTGVLSRYRHLFLTNVLDEYAIVSNEYGKYLLREGETIDAKRQFEQSVAYASDTQTPTAWMYLGLADSILNDCSGAFAAYQHAQDPGVSPNPILLYYTAVTYRDCVKDASTSAEFFARYQAASQTDQPLDTPL